MSLLDHSILPPDLTLSRQSTPMQASKWLKYQVLIDAEEMRSLFEELGDFFIYRLSGLYSRGEAGVTKSDFLTGYADYVNSLKHGELPSETQTRSLFAVALTVSPESLYGQPVDDHRHLVRIAKPVIQQQTHRMDYSVDDGKFRSMILGPETIMWGLQYAYPQIFENPDTRQIESVNESSAFPNTPLFRRLQLWIRHHTTATPFLVGDRRINVPMRLGKQCMDWINNHPQLAKKGLRIKND